MLKAYVTNLGKYNEGILQGTWIEFPVTEEEFDGVLKSIGINERYEEYFFTDFESDFTSLDLSEYESVDFLNELAERLESDTFKAMCEVLGVCEAMGMSEYDCYLLTDVNSDYDLGYYWVLESGCYDLSNMGTLANYIDYESLGRDIRIESEGGFTSYGWLEVMR